MSFLLEREASIEKILRIFTSILLDDRTQDAIEKLNYLE